MWLLAYARHDNVPFLPLYTFQGNNFTKAFLPSYHPVPTSSIETTIVLLICSVVHRHVHPTWRYYANKQNLMGHFTLLKLQHFLKFYSIVTDGYPLKDLFWQVNIKGLVEV